MEDFQEQEYEFLRRLEEERVDRRTLVRRGLAAGIGLDRAVAVAGRARGAEAGAREAARRRGRLVSLAEMVKEAKKEGAPQHDRAAAATGRTTAR